MLVSGPVTAARETEQSSNRGDSAFEQAIPRASRGKSPRAELRANWITVTSVWEFAVPALPALEVKSLRLEPRSGGPFRLDRNEDDVGRGIESVLGMPVLEAQPSHGAPVPLVDLGQPKALAC